jgi:hypothetical protein
MTRIGRAARSFGKFWWDFLVGDAPEIASVVVAIVIAALLLRHHHLIAVVVLPIMAVAGLVLSVLHGRKPS